MKPQAGYARLFALVLAMAIVLTAPTVAAGTATTTKSAGRDVNVGRSARAQEPSECWISGRDVFAKLGADRIVPGDLAPQADNDIPGVPIESVSELPYPLISGNLDSVTDVWDVYSVTAYPGEQIVFHADPDPLNTGAATLDVAVSIWGASATAVSDPAISTRNLGGGPGEPEWICYTVPDGAPTTYYVGARALAGSGAVDYRWGVTSRSDGNIPGVTLPDSGFEGDVHSDRDMDDVYAIHLGQGELLDFDLTVVGTDPVDVYLYPPGTTDVWTGTPEQNGSGTTVSFSYMPDPGLEGVFYIDVFAMDSNADYTVTWSTTGGNVPGAPLPTSSFSNLFPGGYTVYYQDLRAGEVFDFSATDPGDALQVWLLGPDAIDITDPSLAGDASPADPKHFAYQVPEGGAGRYYILVESSGANNSTITWSRTTEAVRLSGRDRYETAALTSRRDFNEGANTVVLASGENFPDALSAAGLAGAYDAPVLLVSTSSLPAYTASEIIRLGATRCIIVGGVSVVSESVKAAIDRLPGMSTPTRIAGVDRYETSAKVADAVFTKCGWSDWVGVCAMARGDDYADALALSPIAWAGKLPVLLTRTNSVPAPIDKRINNVSPDPAARPLLVFAMAFAGGTPAISSTVFDYVTNDLLISSRRFSGPNRYSTAVAIAEWSEDSPWLSYECVGLATGMNYPDALGGGAGMGKRGGILLMTEPTRFTTVTRDALLLRAAETKEAQVFGSTSAVSAIVFSGFGGLYD
jgi:putative cell wall-binding protein